MMECTDLAYKHDCYHCTTLWTLIIPFHPYDIYRFLLSRKNAFYAYSKLSVFLIRFLRGRWNERDKLIVYS
jgi:hypothetical protein